MSSMYVSLEKKLLKTTSKLDIINNMITILNPKTMADKGYSKVYSNGKVVKSVKDVKLDDSLTISLIDGSIETKVVNKGK